MKTADSYRSIGLPENKPAHISLVILGSSRAKVFGYSELLKTTSLLQRSCEVLAQGGAGVVNQLAMLQLFLKKGNSADEIVYLIDPFCFYSEKFNEQSTIGTHIPFRWGDIPLLFRLRYRLDFFLIGYVRPKLLAFKEGTVETGVPSFDAANRIAQLYPQGTTPETLNKYLGIFEEILKIAVARNMKLHAIVSPTLIKNEPGKEDLIRKLIALQTVFPFELRDMSESITDQSYFRDVDHLNTKGMHLFLTRYLRPELTAARKR
jgi:hypothetical protein